MKQPQQEQIQQGTDVATAFQQMSNKNEVAEVLKELFQEGKIHLITELSKDEIRLMTRIYMISELKGFQTWKDGLVMYCKLMLSHKRNSRKEVLEAIGRYMAGGPPQQRGGFFQNLLGGRR